MKASLKPASTKRAEAMSAAVTASMRAVGWNVLFTIGPADDDEFPPHFAGIHQNPRKPIVTFADVRAELALCFDGSSLDNDRKDDDGGNNSGNNGGSGNNSDGGNTARNKPWGGIAFALIETRRAIITRPSQRSGREVLLGAGNTTRVIEATACYQ
ncbi:hypothetical protein ACQRIT_003813 [Beauveria bassiana]